VCLAADPKAVTLACEPGDSECIEEKLFALKKCDHSDATQAWVVNFTDVDGVLDANLVTPAAIIIPQNESSWVSALGFLAGDSGAIGFKQASKRLADAGVFTMPEGMDASYPSGMQKVLGSTGKMPIPLAKEWCAAHAKAAHAEGALDGCAGFSFQAIDSYQQLVINRKDPELTQQERRMLEQPVYQRLRLGPLNNTAAEDRAFHEKTPVQVRVALRAPSLRTRAPLHTS
jgi:hypothetical protein